MLQNSPETKTPESEPENDCDAPENSEDCVVPDDSPKPPSYYYDDACGYEVYSGDDDDENA